MTKECRPAKLWISSNPTSKRPLWRLTTPVRLLHLFIRLYCYNDFEFYDCDISRQSTVKLFPFENYGQINGTLTRSESRLHESFRVTVRGVSIRPVHLLKSKIRCLIGTLSNTFLDDRYYVSFIETFLISFVMAHAKQENQG